MLEGTVKRWVEGRGYGFIEVDGEDDIFVHNTDLDGTYVLMQGQKVEFDVETTPKGPRARNVKVID
ncbi:cold shock domain-containing protein [Candidatus Bathyarchaeota archaeon]|jgi:cold shock protein|nr:cold shock domain-containing protein [Candidatus Bathyarchaeota archaeon]MCK4702433.1 cold shock domain-containing protein [Candidatus Bathyarchaeota archaeon]